MKIQAFATNLLTTVAPPEYVEVKQLKRYWRQNGVMALQVFFDNGYKVDYSQEIDFNKISDHKKHLWYEEIYSQQNQ